MRIKKRRLMNSMWKRLLLCIILIGIGGMAATRLARSLNPQVAPAMDETEVTAVEADSVPSVPTDDNREIKSSTDTESPLFSVLPTSPGENILSVPYISQENSLPTGCEIISAVMLLKYYGYTMDEEAFADYYLDISTMEFANGLCYADSPETSFIGDPYSSSGFGCFAPVIANSLNRILAGKDAVYDTTGTSLADLVGMYIERDMPVLVWASINMLETYDGDSWTVKDTGEIFTWPANEHCLVLVGYDEDEYFFNDPYDSNGVIGYDKELAEKRFAELGEQSVVIVRS